MIIKLNDVCKPHNTTRNYLFAIIFPVLREQNTFGKPTNFLSHFFTKYNNLASCYTMSSWHKREINKKFPPSTMPRPSSRPREQKTAEADDYWERRCLRPSSRHWPYTCSSVTPCFWLLAFDSPRSPIFFSGWLDPSSFASGPSSPCFCAFASSAVADTRKGGAYSWVVR